MNLKKIFYKVLTNLFLFVILGSKKAPSRNLTRTQLMTASTGNNRLVLRIFP